MRLVYFLRLMFCGGASLFSQLKAESRQETLSSQFLPFFTLVVSLSYIVYGSCGFFFFFFLILH